MRRHRLLYILLALVLLSGCSMRTLDQLYCVPKRSEEHSNLQLAIDQNMSSRTYCAPLSGENTQAVQMADLDGDGVEEYLLFAKGSSEKPLNILIFKLFEKGYALADTIETVGAAFDVVEYAQVDDKPGVELIVGMQISNQVARSVSVYRFFEGKLHQLLNTNYAQMLPWDLYGNGQSALMVLRAGSSEESSGVAELYRYENGIMERSNEAAMSQPVENVKRIITGRLQNRTPAIYIASTVEQDALITDIFAEVEGVFTNVSANHVETLRNYYVYADDIDSDGVVELPSLMTALAPPGESLSQQHLIRWYSVTAEGETVDKAYTFHNYPGGWYLSLDSRWASRMAVVQQENRIAFYLWDEDYVTAQRLFTVQPFTGSERHTMAVQDNRFVLYEDENTVYSGYLEVESAAWGITRDSLIQSFHSISSQWQTGEV